MLRDRAPKLGSVDGGSAWLVDGLRAGAAAPHGGNGFGLPAPRTARTESRSRFDEVLPALYDPAERLKAQDSDSVDAEVLYPSADLWDAIRSLEDRDLKLACVRAYNDWIAEFSAHNPDRLIGLGKIPATTCEDAREELRPLRQRTESARRGPRRLAGRRPRRPIPTTTRSGRRSTRPACR